MPNTPDSTKDIIAAIDLLKADIVTALNAIPKAYGNFNANNVAIAVVITIVDTFVKIGSGMSAGLLLNVSFQNASELVIQTAGKYLIEAQVSCTSATTAEEVELCVQVDGTPNLTATAHTETSIGAVTRPAVICVNGIFNLTANQVLSLALSNHSTTADLQVQHANLTVLKIA
jgi:hypothetical protein